MLFGLHGSNVADIGIRDLIIKTTQRVDQKIDEGSQRTNKMTQCAAVRDLTKQKMVDLTDEEGSSAMMTRALGDDQQSWTFQGSTVRILIVGFFERNIFLK